MFFKKRARSTGLKTLHLHIGWPKCGSSSLQWILGKNQDLLLKQGFYYPLVPGKGINFGNGKPLLRDNFRSETKKKGSRFFQRHPDIVNISDRPEYFRKNYLNTEAENLVISAEGLYRGSAQVGFIIRIRSFQNHQNLLGDQTGSCSECSPAISTAFVQENSNWS